MNLDVETYICLQQAKPQIRGECGEGGVSWTGLWCCQSLQVACCVDHGLSASHLISSHPRLLLQRTVENAHGMASNFGVSTSFLRENGNGSVQPLQEEHDLASSRLFSLRHRRCDQL